MNLMPKLFHDRVDGPFLHLLKECPYIHTLVILYFVLFHVTIIVIITFTTLRIFNLIGTDLS